MSIQARRSTITSLPISAPSYGVNSTVESGSYGQDQDDEEEEGWELQNVLANVDEYYSCRYTFGSPLSCDR